MSAGRRAFTLVGMSDLTRLLDAAAAGDAHAADQLLPLVYEELRKLAAQRLAREAAIFFFRREPQRLLRVQLWALPPPEEDLGPVT